MKLRAFCEQHGPVNFQAELPLSLNNAYTNAKGRKGRVLTKEARDYKDRLRQYLRENYPMRVFEEEGDRVALSYVFYFPDRIRRDIANYEKLLTDAIAEEWGFNDTLVDVLHLERGGIDKDYPRVMISAWIVASSITQS